MPPTPAHNITTTTAPTEEEDGGGDVTGTSAGLVGAVLFIAVIIVIVVLSKRLRHNKDPEERTDSGEEAESGSSDEEEENIEMLDKYSRQMSVMSCDSFKFPMWKEVDDRVKASVSSLLIDTKTIKLGDVIGKGQFGMVYEAQLSKDGRLSNDYGEISHEKVAVKTLKGSNINKETIEAFLREGMIMRDLKHKNVLTLMGVALGDHGIPMIVLPFMANGNLKKFISKAHLKITVRELLAFGKEIAAGMNYLGEQNFVHRDLAARNCMLDDLFTVKVADFGLSRDMYEKEYYCSGDMKAKLPVKWMAPESIARSRYTTSSDVWSYGVLLWELMTRGAVPYPDVANWDVHSYIREGRRMAQPQHCPDVIYDLMLTCWKTNPEERPSFKDIVQIMHDLLEPRQSIGGEDEDNDGDAADYCNIYVNVMDGDL